MRNERGEEVFWVHSTAVLPGSGESLVDDLLAAKVVRKNPGSGVVTWMQLSNEARTEGGDRLTAPEASRCRRFVGQQSQKQMLGTDGPVAKGPGLGRGLSNHFAGWVGEELIHGHEPTVRTSTPFRLRMRGREAAANWGSTEAECSLIEQAAANLRLPL